VSSVDRITGSTVPSRRPTTSYRASGRGRRRPDPTGAMIAPCQSRTVRIDGTTGSAVAGRKNRVAGPRPGRTRHSALPTLIATRPRRMTRRPLDPTRAAALTPMPRPRPEATRVWARRLLRRIAEPARAVVLTDLPCHAMMASGGTARPDARGNPHSRPGPSDRSAEPPGPLLVAGTRVDRSGGQAGRAAQ
jgi:hypothetical protein